MAKDLQFKHYETLHGLLNMYSREPEEVLVEEAVANGMDAKAKKIDIKLIKDKEEYFIAFHNNGLPMSKEDFENYHTVSSSFKVKGEGIGFAGVGAKIFLGVEFETEIFTITGENEKSLLVSRMYRNGKNIKYETNLEEPIPISLHKTISNATVNHTYGTTYQVKLTAKGYTYLKQEIIRILQFWFDPGIISNRLQITVDGTIVEPTNLSKDKFKKIVTHKGQKIDCIFYISKEVIPEEQRHIVYSVFGKRIKNESGDFSYQIVEEMRKKVSCYADVSILTDCLTTGKEDFHKNPKVNNVKIRIKEEFQKFLKENNLIKSTNNVEDTKEINNDITKRLDIALQTKDLRFLNPFSKSTVQLLPVSKVEGEIKISELEGTQSTNGLQENDYNISESSMVDPKQGMDFAKDDKGDKLGENKERHSKGIRIIPVIAPDDQREGWIDFDINAIVYNDGHNFVKSVEKNKGVYNYNLLRVISQVIITNKNDHAHMDAIKTIEYYNKILHKVWK
jgi:hypothetical protein